MTTKHFALVLVFAWGSVATAGARVFDTEQKYVSQYGANLNKGVPAPPPYKLALYLKKQVVVVVLFENQVSQGELISKPRSRITEADVTGILAVNQGPSSWKKEKVETTKNPNTPQVSMWQRKDGKLFALYSSSPAPFPYVLIGTRGAGAFLMKQKNLASYVKP